MRGADEGDGPLVTIVIPAFDAGEFLREAVESALAQTWGQLEILVIDDASDDATASIAQRFAHIERVRVIRNRGLRGRTGKPGACNLGLSLARGEIIVGLDADTVFDSDLISNLAQRFEDPNVGVVAGNVTAGNWDTNLLTRLQSLEYLAMANCPGLSRARLAALEKALPGCRVVRD